MVKISIIIPVYNTEKHLKQCLDSVFSQDLEDVEVICINDGSTDNSLEILNQYQQIKLINKENTGVGDSRNKGLEVSTGEYVLFLDSDDFLEPDSLKKLYNKAASSGAEVVFFNINKYFEENGRKNFFNYTEPYYRKFKDTVFSPIEAKEVLFQTTAHPFKMYKRETITNCSAKYTDSSFGEDQSFFYNIITNFDKLCVLNDVIINYRIHKNSSTANFSGEKYSDIFREFYLCEKIIENSKYGKDLINLYIKSRLSSVFYWFEKVDNKQKFYGQLKELLKHLQKKYSKNIFENCFEKKEIKKILKHSYYIYNLEEKISTSFKIIRTYLN